MSSIESGYYTPSVMSQELPWGGTRSYLRKFYWTRHVTECRDVCASGSSINSFHEIFMGQFDEEHDGTALGFL